MRKTAIVTAALLLGTGQSLAADVDITSNRGATNLNDLTALGTTVNVSAGVRIDSVGVGLVGQQRPWTITNGGTIVGGTATGIASPFGIYLLAGGSVTNLSGATIDGRGDGVHIAGAPATVDNAGVIVSRAFPGQISTNAAIEITLGGRVLNSGRIEGSQVGVLTGRILSAGSSFIADGTATVTNSGSISAITHHGVQMEGGGTLLNTASGVIEGGLNGAVIGSARVFLGPDSLLTNDGTIRGSNTGVYVQYGGAVLNRGTITGRYGLVMLEAGTVTNAGVITGTTGDAILFDYVADSSVRQFPNVADRPNPSTSQRNVHTLILQTGSVINGTVNGGYADNQLVLEGSGTEDSQFIAFTDLTMRGTRWTLSSTATVVNRINIESGALYFSGRMIGAVNIGEGRTLGGRGTFASISNAGTIAPGESIGTLAVTGDYTHAVSATLEVEVDAAGQSDLITVGGRATLNGGAVAVLPSAGEYAPLSTYTILTATGGITGQFSSVTSSLAFLTPTLIYESNAVRLQLFNNSLSGDIFPSLRSLAAQSAHQQAGRIGASIRETSVEANEYVVWTDALFRSQRVDDGIAEPLRSGTSEVLAGVTAGLRGGFEVGGYLGAGQSGIDGTASENSAEQDSLTVGAYAAYTQNGFKGAFSYARGWDDVSVTRVLTSARTARATFDARRDILIGQISFDGGAESFGVSPYASIVHTAVRFDAFTETGAGALNASSIAEKTVSTVSRLGLRASHKFIAGENTIEPYAGLAWAHEHKQRFANQSLTFAAAPNRTFAMRGAVLPGDTAEAEAGFAHAKGMWRLMVGYWSAYGDSAKSHGVRAALGATW